MICILWMKMLTIIPLCFICELKGFYLPNVGCVCFLHAVCWQELCSVSTPVANLYWVDHHTKAVVVVSIFIMCMRAKPTLCAGTISTAACFVLRHLWITIHDFTKHIKIPNVLESWQGYTKYIGLYRRSITMLHYAPSWVNDIGPPCLLCDSINLTQQALSRS